MNGIFAKFKRIQEAKQLGVLLRDIPALYVVLKCTVLCSLQYVCYYLLPSGIIAKKNMLKHS